MRLWNYFVLFLTLIQSYNAHVRDEDAELLEIQPTYLSADNNYSVVLLEVDPPENFVLTIPDECLELHICENIPNYPQEHVSNIIKKLSYKNILLYTDDETLEDLQINKDQSYEELCPSTPKFYYPQAVLSIHKKRHLILNSKEIPQNIFARTCKDPPSRPGSCSSTAIIQNQYYGECRQEYLQKTLIGLDETLGKVIEVVVEVATCCACQVFIIDDNK